MIREPAAGPAARRADNDIGERMGGFKPVFNRFWAKPALFVVAAVAAWTIGPATTAFAAPAGHAADLHAADLRAGRPVAAGPDPFNGAVPGDVSNGQGALPPANNPPGAGPVVNAAMPGANAAQTRFGVVDDVDRLFLVKVRQAGLWERPTCLRAAAEAASPRLKEICQVLASDHVQLDEEGRFVAQQLNVALPDQPSAEQQAWMREIWPLRGHDFDVTAVKWLRFAHGGVFTAIASVRANTRNETMRLLAERANLMVNKHMALLESTGLVQFDNLPHAAIGAPAAALAAQTALAPKDTNVFRLPVAALVVVAGLLALVSIRRVVRGG